MIKILKVGLEETLRKLSITYSKLVQNLWLITLLMRWKHVYVILIFGDIIYMTCMFRYYVWNWITMHVCFEFVFGEVASISRICLMYLRVLPLIRNRVFHGMREEGHGSEGEGCLHGRRKILRNCWFFLQNIVFRKVYLIVRDGHLIQWMVT